MTIEIDVFFSFRSPYSGLAAPLAHRLATEWDIRFRLRPVLPLIVRDPGFFARANPLFLPYLMRDIPREAARLGIPFGPPQPDPVVVDYAAMRAAEDQPHIHRITRLGIAAEEAGQGLAFATEVSRLIWGGAANWPADEHLAPACARAGLSLETLETKTLADPGRYDAVIADNQEALQAAGHWGVPTFVLDGEPFFGQDRLPALMAALQAKGVRRRGDGPVTRDFLVGCWQLARWELHKNHALHALPHGETARGQLIHTADGRMSTMLQHADWAGARADSAPDWGNFLAWSGSWTLENAGADQYLCHDITMASLPGRVGERQRRRATKLGPDSFVFETPARTGRKNAVYVNRLTWARAG